MSIWTNRGTRIHRNIHFLFGYGRRNIFSHIGATPVSTAIDDGDGDGNPALRNDIHVSLGYNNYFSTVALHQHHF